MRRDARKPGLLSTLVALAGGCALFATGCVDRAPVTARDVAPPPCACGAPVETESAPVDSVDSLARDGAVVAPRPGTRLQGTVSLGYAGDGKLTQLPMRREWWGDRDRGPVAYGGYAYGYGGRGPRGPGGHAAQAPSQGFAAPPLYSGTGMSTPGGGSRASAPPPAFFPGRAPR